MFLRWFLETCQTQSMPKAVPGFCCCVLQKLAPPGCVMGQAGGGTRYFQLNPGDLEIASALAPTPGANGTRYPIFFQKLPALDSQRPESIWIFWAGITYETQPLFKKKCEPSQHCP
eukprot:EG_transcript_10636